LRRLNDSRAVFRLRSAAVLLPEELVFPCMAGIILLKERKYERALSPPLRNAAYEYRVPLIRTESRVRVECCLDLVGRRVKRLPVTRRPQELRRCLSRRFEARQLLYAAPECILGAALAKY